MMLTTENVKNWLKTKVDTGDGIAVGAIDGNKDRYIGVYDRKTGGKQYICVGGQEQTKTGKKGVSVLVHWTTSPVTAEAKAREIYSLFYGLTDEDMDGVTVYLSDPGGSPIGAGRDERGICEYVIDVELTYRKD